MKLKRASKARTVTVEIGPGESELLAATPAFQLKKILVPIDFSDCSKKALQYAVPFAEQFHASLDLLYVVEIPYGTGDVGMVDIDRWVREMQQSGEHRLEELIEETEVGPALGQVLVRQGVAYQAIPKVAQELQTDLIILSTHGHSGFSRVFLGSTTERVVRHAPCPVLVVREREHEFVRPAATRVSKRAAADAARTPRASATGATKAKQTAGAPRPSRRLKMRRQGPGVVIEPEKPFGRDVHFSKP